MVLWALEATAWSTTVACAPVSMSSGDIQNFKTCFVVCETVCRAIPPELSAVEDGSQIGC